MDPNDLAWKTGQFIFDNVRLHDILNTLERYFNVSIETSKSTERYKDLYTVKFVRNDDLDEILRILEIVVGGGMRFEQKDVD